MGDRATAAMTFYSSLQTIPKKCSISLIEFKDLTSDTKDYYVPTTVNLTTEIQQFKGQEYAALLGHKVISDLKHEHVQNAMITQFTVHNDGYQLLNTIMTTRPSCNKPQTLFAYEMDLKMFYQTEESYNIPYTDTEKMATFQIEITGDTHFKAAITEARKECPNEKHGIVPERYQLGNIARTIANSTLTEPPVGYDVFHTNETTPHMGKTFPDDIAPCICVAAIPGKEHKR
eukprot:jgi/Psemu1/292767/fgenesh1_pg.1289_\